MKKVIFLKLGLSLILLTTIFILILYNSSHKTASLINAYTHQAKGQVEVQVGTKKYNLYQARTASERSLGLSVFEDIRENEGMAFYFEIPAYYEFFMKGMKFDIDIIFLDKNQKVVTIHENVSTGSYESDDNYERFKSYSPAKYVVELKAGQIQENGIKIGDIILLESKN